MCSSDLDSRKNLVCVLSNFILHTAKYRMLNFIKHITTVKVSELARTFTLILTESSSNRLRDIMVYVAGLRVVVRVSRTDS